MSKEILAVVEMVSNEKGIDKEKVFQSIEAALAMAVEKRTGIEDMEARVHISRKNGEYDLFRRWHVLNEDDVEFPAREWSLAEAQQKDANLKIGDVYEEKLQPMEFGRISAQIVKQVMSQLMRSAERDQVAQEYRAKVGSLITCTVKKTTRDNIILDLGNNAEAILPREYLLPREAVRPGDRVRAYLYEIVEEARGPQLYVSRTHPNMLVELFRIEVPEIAEDLIQIVAAARDPGVRAKIAVKTNDKRIDPIGACVGMRGSRVQAVSGELGGERIDIILWDDNPAQLVINAMAPAEVSSIVVDEDSHAMDIAVAEDKLSQAIGRNGQNVKLATELTGWALNVMTDKQAGEKSDAEAQTIIHLFVAQLDIDEDIAKMLVDEGFTSLEEIAYVPVHELLDVDGFDEEIVTELRQRATDALLQKAIEADAENQPTEDLLTMDGMTEELAYALAKQGIRSMEDLAEQAVGDLTELVNIDDERAAALIMTARKPWFNE